MGGETISNWDASKLGRLSYDESSDVRDARAAAAAVSPVRGGEDAVSGVRTRGGDDAEALEDILGLPLCDCRLAVRSCDCCWAYCWLC